MCYRIFHVTFCGLDLAVGLSSSNGLYGYETRNVSTPDVTVYEHSLYKTPEKVEFLSAKPDKVRKGEETKVEFEVFDVGFVGKTLPTFLPQLVKFEGDGVIESTAGVLSKTSALLIPTAVMSIIATRLHPPSGSMSSSSTKEARTMNMASLSITKCITASPPVPTATIRT